jgi:hypothetical protein
MAFDIHNLKMGRERGIFRNHRWNYETTDSQATMNTAGYFNGLAALGGQIGDEIYATVWDSAVPAGPHPVPGSSVIDARVLLIVNAISAGGVVDVANGDAYVFDSTPPIGYAVAFHAGSYSIATTAATARVDITGAEVGAAYALSIASSGGGTPVTATGTVASGTFNITPLDLHLLTAGTLTATLTLTDTVGNVGSPVTGTATLGA